MAASTRTRKCSRDWGTVEGGDTVRRYVTVIAPTIALALTVANAAGPRLLVGYVVIAAAEVVEKVVEAHYRMTP